MQILGLLGMYFDAAVVFVTNSDWLCPYYVIQMWPAEKLNKQICIAVRPRNTQP